MDRDGRRRPGRTRPRGAQPRWEAGGLLTPKSLRVLTSPWSCFWRENSWWRGKELGGGR